MELLATIDWLIQHDKVQPERDAVKAALKNWSGGPESAERKQRLFEDRLIDLALLRLTSFN
jgi:hypothetical protein